MNKDQIKHELKELDDEWERLDKQGNQIVKQNKIAEQMQKLQKQLDSLSSTRKPSMKIKIEAKAAEKKTTLKVMPSGHFDYEVLPNPYYKFHKQMIAYHTGKAAGAAGHEKIFHEQQASKYKHSMPSRMSKHRVLKLEFKKKKK